MSYVSNTLYQGSSQHDLTTESQSSENTISKDLGVEIHTPGDDIVLLLNCLQKK